MREIVGCSQQTKLEGQLAKGKDKGRKETKKPKAEKPKAPPSIKHPQGHKA